MKICASTSCSNISNDRRFCSTCRSRISRSKNKIKYAYETLKNNAKRRNKEFDLTFDQFKEFALKVDYLKKKGVKSYSYHIDRIDETKGYSVGNLQLLTNSQNVKKYLKYVYNEKDRKMKFWNNTVKTNINQKDEDCPF